MNTTFHSSVRRLVAVAAAVSFASAPLAHAREPQLVTEINVGPATDGTENLDFETRFIRIDNRAVFAVDDGIHGTELWISDGTEAGTRLLADICPGACPSGPLELVGTGDQVYFTAEDGSHGRELWVTDGTAAGTRLVLDIAPGLADSRPRNLAISGRRVGFAAIADDGSGWEPWVSDGTASGTQSLGDLRPGPDSSGPRFWEEVGGSWLFLADDGTRGFELWSTDGTASGTHILLELVPGPDDGLIPGESFQMWPPYVRFGERLFFFALAPDGSYLLSATDGTAAGTKTLHPAGQPHVPYGLAVFDDRVFFSGRSPEAAQLFATDGSSVELIATFPGNSGHWGPRDLVMGAGRLLFVAGDDLHGAEVWSTDGTQSGTSLVADLRPGTQSGLPFRYAGFVPAGGRLLFFADDGATGHEPWLTDGTSPGTTAAGDLFPGLSSSVSPYLPHFIDRRAELDGSALFRAWTPDSGLEPQRIDGLGNLQRLEVNRQTSSWRYLWNHWFSSIPLQRPLGVLDHRVVFLAYEPMSTGIEPWISDGSPQGTHLLRDLRAGLFSSFPFGFFPTASGGLFVADASAGPRRLWHTDGTPEGTVPLSTADGDNLASQLVSTARIGNLTLFVEESPLRTLWVTDGTASGTRDLPARVPYAQPLLSDDQWVYFGADEPRRTDGLTVEPLGDIRPGSDGSEPYPLATAGGRALFAADDGNGGHELWASTDTGMQRLREIHPGPTGGLPDRPGYWVTGEFQAAGSDGQAFFAADDGTSGQELWTSDGTAAGTRRVRDIRPGPRASEIRWLTSAGGHAFFSADDGANGRELWVSSGSEDGTRMLADLMPGPRSSLPQELRAVGDSVYFSAHTPAHGRELWKVDVTTFAFERVSDIAPGPLPSSPMVLTPAGGSLYFMANDGTRGFELWRLPLPGEIFADGFESGNATAWSAAAP